MGRSRNLETIHVPVLELASHIQKSSSSFFFFAFSFLTVLLHFFVHPWRNGFNLTIDASSSDYLLGVFSASNKLFNLKIININNIMKKLTFLTLKLFSCDTNIIGLTNTRHEHLLCLIGVNLPQHWLQTGQWKELQE